MEDPSESYSIGESSTFSDSDMQKEEELTWAPSSILISLSGFHPEEGLEFTWTPDGSIATSSGATSVASDGDTIASDAFTFSSGLTSRHMVYNVTEERLKLSESFEYSPSRLKFPSKWKLAQSYSDMSYDAVPSDEAREQDMMREHSRVAESDSTEEIRDHEMNEGPKLSVEAKSECLLPDGSVEQVLQDTKYTPSVEQKSTTEPTTPSPPNMHQCSVEVSLIEQSKSPTRMMRLKTSMHSLFSRLRKKEAKEIVPATQKDEASCSDEQVSVDKTITKVETSRNDEEITEDATPPVQEAPSEESNERKVTPLSRKITPLPSTKDTEVELSDDGPDQPDTAKVVGPADNFVTKILVGLGCLVVP